MDEQLLRASLDDFIDAWEEFLLDRINTVQLTDALVAHMKVIDMLTPEDIWEALRGSLRAFHPLRYPILPWIIQIAPEPSYGLWEYDPPERVKNELGTTFEEPRFFGERRTQETQVKISSSGLLDSEFLPQISSVLTSKFILPGRSTGGFGGETQDLRDLSEDN